jgi:serine/threonine protein kinase
MSLPILFQTDKNTVRLQQVSQPQFLQTAQVTEPHTGDLIQQTDFYTLLKFSPGRDHDRSRRYVLKQFSTLLPGAAAYESAALSKCQNPTIARVFPALSPSPGCVVLENLTSVSFTQLPSFSPTDQQKAIYGLAYGLNYLHSHNIIHPWLTPECVRFAPDSEIRIWMLSGGHDDSQFPISSAESNVFSFGQILRTFCGHNVHPRLRGLIETCVDASPSNRPTSYELVLALREPVELVQQADLEQYALYIEKLDSFALPSPPIGTDTVNTRPLLSDVFVSLDDYSMPKPQPIGIGAYSQVFSVLEKRSGSEIALKEYDRRVSCKPDFRKSLLRELEILFSLEHPAIVRVIGHDIFNVRQGAPWPIIAMEFLPRGSLDEVLAKDNEFDATQKMKAIYGLVSAIAFMHGRRPIVIHRDLKPSNILVDLNYEIRICDFNQSKWTEEELLMASCTVGSPLYRAPELFEMTRPYDCSVDVYSLGLIIYSIIAEDTPFPGSPDMEKLNRLRRGERPETIP